MSKRNTPKFKIEETAILLREPTGDFIVFKGTIAAMREYMAWYKDANGGKILTIQDTNVFIVEKE